MRKNILGAGEKGHFSFREQGAKTPPPCGGLSREGIVLSE